MCLPYIRAVFRAPNNRCTEALIFIEGDVEIYKHETTNPTFVSIISPFTPPNAVEQWQFFPF
jgi:hypothetical protein